MTMESDIKYPIYNKGTVVYSDGPSDYICHICPEDETDSLEHHLKGENHCQRLEYYTQFFTNVGPIVSCKLCLTRVNFSQVMEHALRHKLFPWYVPEYNPEILFKNFISQRDNQYFCHLCNVKLPFSSLIECHNEEKHHLALKRDKIDEVILQNLSFTISYYQLASNNSIFMKTPESLSCSLCDCDVGIIYEEIVSHIEAKSHIQNLRGNIEAFDSTGIYHLPSEYQICKINEIPLIKIRECNNNNSEEQCKLIVWTPVSHQELSDSNSSIDGVQSNGGATSDEDNEIVKKIDKEMTLEDNNFTSDDEKSVIAATEIIVHPISEENSSIELLNKPLQPINEATSDQKLPEGIENTEKVDHFMCKMCHRKIIGYHDAFKHVEGKKHVNKLRKQQDSLMAAVNGGLLNDEVSSKLQTDALPKGIIHRILKCKCLLCSCRLSGLGAIPEHVNGSRHKSQVLRQHSNEKPLSVDLNGTNSSQQSTINKNTDGEKFDDLPERIIHVISECYFCILCRCRMPGLESVENHVEDSSHQTKFDEYFKNKSDSISPEQSFHSTCSSLTISFGALTLDDDDDDAEIPDAITEISEVTTEEELLSLGEEVFLTECKFCHQEILGGPETLSSHINSRRHKEKKEAWTDFSCFYDDSEIQEDPKFDKNGDIKYFMVESLVPAEDMIRVVEVPKGAMKSECKSFYWCSSCSYRSSEGGIPDGHLNCSFHLSSKGNKSQISESSTPSTSTSEFNDGNFPEEITTSAIDENIQLNSNPMKTPPQDPNEGEKSYQLPEQLIKLRNLEKFWCTVCCMPGSLQDASAHASRKRHLNKLEEWRKRELRKNPKKLSEQSPPELSLGNATAQRLLSNCHLGKVNPVASSASVKPEDQNIGKVPCEICNCLIPGGNWNVNVHRNGRAHLENEARMKATLKGPDQKEARALSPQLPRGFSLSDIPPENILQNHYIGHIIDCVECKICDLKIHGTCHTSVTVEYLNHMISQEHKEKENIFIDGWTLSQVNSASLPKRRSKKKKKKQKGKYQIDKPISCPICGEQFQYENGLHGHMTLHFWKRFLEFPPISTKSASPDKNGESNQIPADESTDSTATDEDLEYEEKSTKTEQRTVPSTHHFRSRPLDIALDDKLNIYEIDKQKIEDLEIGVLLSFIIDKDTIYCLVCRKRVKNSLQNFYEHLCSVVHLEYLQEMIEDHRKFRDYPDQLSDLALAQEYMQEVSNDDVHCYACRVSINNDSIKLNRHINGPSHKKKWSLLGANASELFNPLHSRMETDFYSTQSYWCVPCEMNWSVEVEFREHLNKNKHKKKIQRFKNEIMMFDYCALCATLWYGFLKTYSYHSTCKIHKNQAMNSYYLVNKIPHSAEKLLYASEKKIVEILANVDSRRIDDKKNVDQLIGDLQRISKQKYPSVKVYPFGSRITGLAGRHSDLDIFLDCSITRCPVYSGENSSYKQILVRIRDIKKCLEGDPQNWLVDREIRDCRIPIINATHRPTGIECNISFSNGLTVENTKIIGAYCDSYPQCRKLIIFVKNWMGHCELTGVNGINSYGIAWLVIYFLQVKMILPTITELIERKKQSRIIKGWETGVSTDFQPRDNDDSFRQLLMEFFRFYEAFDYRNYVICPLVGGPVGKRLFQRPSGLSSIMKPYLNYLRRSDDPEPFRVDSIMCLQDPFDLAHNILKAVEKIVVHRFKTLCSLSAQILDNNA